MFLLRASELQFFDEAGVAVSLNTAEEIELYLADSFASLNDFLCDIHTWKSPKKRTGIFTASVSRMLEVSTLEQLARKYSKRLKLVQNAALEANYDPEWIRRAELRYLEGRDVVDFLSADSSYYTPCKS